MCWTMQISSPKSSALTYRRFLPLAVLAVILVVCYGLGVQRYLGIQNLLENEGFLQNFVAQNLILALAIYFTVYVIAVSLSLPGSALLTCVGGFIFGWVLSAPVTVIAATIGAMAVFKIVQTSLGATLSEKAGPFVQRLSRGFENDAFSYLLFLRLVPAFPFFAVNAVAGLTKIPLRSFALATVIGIIPGTVAFSIVGRGLGSVLDSVRTAHTACVSQDATAACPYQFSASSLITPQLLWGFAALGVVSLIPVLLKIWKRR